MVERSIIDLSAEPGTLLPRVVLPSAKLTAETVEIPNPVDYEFSVRSEAHYLAYHELSLSDGRMRVEGDRSYRGQDLRGTLTFFPAGTAAEGWCKPMDRLQGFTSLYFDVATVQEALRTDPCWDRPAVYFRCVLLSQTMAKVAHALKKPLPFRDLLIDMLGQVAIAEFAASQTAILANIGERALSEADLHRLDEFLRANITRSIQLGEMASIVGLSKFHFIRCFRAATQRTPYRSLLELRSEIALQKLRAGSTPREAAIAAGFEDAAQMARTMRNALGVTPRDIVRSLK